MSQLKGQPRVVKGLCGLACSGQPARGSRRRGAIIGVQFHQPDRHRSGFLRVVDEFGQAQRPAGQCRIREHRGLFGQQGEPLIKISLAQGEFGVQQRQQAVAGNGRLWHVCRHLDGFRRCGDICGLDRRGRGRAPGEENSQSECCCAVGHHGQT